MNPFPSMHLMSGGADCKLSIREDDLDLGTSDSLNLSPLLRRDGFSVANTMVWDSGQALASGSFPGAADPAASLQENSAIQVWDLERGVRIPFLAELDAYPELLPQEQVLLIRPLESMGFSSHIGVVITDQLLLLDGSPAVPPNDFLSLREGNRDSGVDPRVAAHYRGLLERLEELGVLRQSITFAWDFRTGSKANITAPLDRIVESMRVATPLGEELNSLVEFSQIDDALEGGSPTAPLWREVRGSLSLPHFLWDERGEESPTEADHDHGWFQLDAEGLPILRGDAPAYFTLIVPETLQGAPAGSAPVVVFGHGIFANPQRYLAAAGDPNSTMELCARLNAICVGTEWRGLTLRDSPDALRAAMDLSRFPLVTDKLHQGLANQLAMARMMKTSFAESSFLQASDGSGSLVDPERMYYFGISLGGIEGAIFLASSELIDTGVLHVPGAMWSTMLERSVHWGDFEDFVLETQPDPRARQFAYALLQLFWDPVDPITHSDSFSGRNILWQVSRGDEQVPNFTAEALARSAGIPLAEPKVWDVFGLDRLEADSGVGQSALYQWDSGIDVPENINRPPPAETGAHTSIRHLEEMMSQVEAFLEGGQEGRILNACNGPCVFDLSDER